MPSPKTAIAAAVQPESKQRLIDATITAIYEHGISNLTLAKIAGLAGFTAATVNFHFTSKEALLLATLRHVAEEFEQAVTRCLESVGDHPGDALRAIVAVNLDPVLSEPRKVAVWFAFFSESKARDDYQQLCGDRDRAYFAKLLDLCTRIVADGPCAETQDAEAIAYGLSGLLNELWTQILFHGQRFDRSAARRRCEAYLASVFPWAFAGRRLTPVSRTPNQRTNPQLVVESEGLVSALPSWTYGNTEFFELEREHVFIPAWHLVCHINDIPQAGDYHTFSLLGELAFVVRGEDGTVRAFHNVCRHRAARLLDGDRGHCTKLITCPYHAWAYQFDGRLVGVPYRTQYPGLGLNASSLVPIECEVFLGFIFIRFENGGYSLEELLAPAIDELKLYRTEALQPLGKVATRPLRTNWKNGTDNYIDALHVRVAHPGLNSLVGNTYTLEERGWVHRLMGSAKGVSSAGPSVRAYTKYLPDVPHLPPPYNRLWLYYMVWPNFAFNLYPDLVEFMQFIPVSPTECVIRDASYALPDSRREMHVARWLNLRINRGVGQEDKDLIERVQAGMGSRSYVAGPLGRNEICLRGFARRLREVIPVSRLTAPPAQGTVAEHNRTLREKTA